MAKPLRRSSIPSQVESPAELAQKIVLIEQQLKEMRRHISSGTMPAQKKARGHLREEEISLGLEVVVRVESGRYVHGRIRDIAQTQVDGHKLFIIDRLDNVVKELTPKKAKNIFPIEMLPLLASKSGE